MAARLHEVKHVRMMAEARRIGTIGVNALEYPAIPAAIDHACRWISAPNRMLYSKVTVAVRHTLD
jgi:hypothetical protein